LLSISNVTVQTEMQGHIKANAGPSAVSNAGLYTAHKLSTSANRRPPKLRAYMCCSTPSTPLMRDCWNV